MEEVPTQPPLTQSVNSHPETQNNTNRSNKVKVIVSLFILSAFIILLIGIYMLDKKYLQDINKKTTPNQTQSTIPPIKELDKSTIKDAVSQVSISNLKEENPKEVTKEHTAFDLKGKTYKATELKISADLNVPFDGDYFFFASYDDTGSYVTIDGISYNSYAVQTHLLKGKHLFEIIYTQSSCLPIDYLKENNLQPQKITVEVRIKEGDRKIGNGTYPIYSADSTRFITLDAQPRKKTDFYIHCPEVNKYLQQKK